MNINIQICAPDDTDIIIYKWKCNEGSVISSGNVILIYKLAGNEAEVKRLKTTKCGTVTKRLIKEGDLVEKGHPMLEIAQCFHNTVIKEMCADCGADLQHLEGQISSASVPMIHSQPELKVTEKLAKKLGRADTDRLLKDRKLVLLVDLDQTIIHTTNDNVPSNLKDVYHFQLYGPHSPWYHTRIRPGTINFLKNIELLYELHICTFGARNYAHMITQFLDESGRLFSQRILSRDECLNATSKKDNLKSLFPDDCGDAMVCIIDDREDVWNHATNLIQVKPYHFFQHTGDINAPSSLTKKELDGKGVDFNKVVKRNMKSKTKLTVTNSELSSTDANLPASQLGLNETNEVVLNNTEGLAKTNIELESVKIEHIQKENDEKSYSNLVNTKSGSHDFDANLIEIEDPDDYLLYLEHILNLIHTRFYEITDSTKKIPDLKLLIPKLKSEILIGVSICFSGLVPSLMKLEYSKPYLIAKELGAKVTENIICDETTHLVAAGNGTHKVSMAQKNRKIKIVTPDWLWTCAERWEHVSESIFPLGNRKTERMRKIPLHCSPERLQAKEEIRFIDTINPYMVFSKDDIASMTEEVDNETESSSDDDDELIDSFDTTTKRDLLKRKIVEDEMLIPEVTFCGKKIETDNTNSTKKSFVSNELRPINVKETIRSDLDISEESEDDILNDSEWNLLGAELEREFLE
ncbi:unnamed protein product [Diamesa serratosioi]